MTERRYWLVKSEPDVYSIDDLARDQQTCWEGVRNYQARNLMRDDMQRGDGVLYYHSRVKPMGIVGTATVSRGGYPDHHSWDPASRYFDAKSSADAPRWFMVDLAFERRFAQTLTLDALKADPALEGMPLLRKGQRLSVQPVSAAHYAHILGLAGVG